MEQESKDARQKELDFRTEKQTLTQQLEKEQKYHKDELIKREDDIRSLRKEIAFANDTREKEKY